MQRVLTRRIEIPLPRERVFQFFANAENLGVITPRSMHFRIRTPLPITMREGALIDYTIRVNRIPMRWRTLISRWDPPFEFVDEQLRGPYRKWVHTHRFFEIPGGTAIEDHVLYEIGFGPIGLLVAPLIRRQLDAIFDYRSRVVAELLAGGERIPARV